MKTVADGGAMRGALAGVGEWLRGIRPRRRDLKTDVLAGLPGAISAVPDGMASAVLVGVSPAYGLYASFAGPIGGGLSTSTRLMVVTTTTAGALAAGSALAEVPVDERAGALVVLTFLVAGLMIVAGLFHLGRYVRFVSRSVMLGFLTGVAVNIVLGQLADLLGARGEGEIALVKAWHVITHPAGINAAATSAGAGALALLIVIDRTRIALFGSLIAVAVPTVVVALSGGGSVATVSDTGAIPSGFPPLALPHLADFRAGLVSGALAVAAIVLIQGAGVAQAAPNPDGTLSNTDRDFIGQGVANAAAGLFHGVPDGGSVGATALNLSAGARSRWAAIFAGIWMLMILVAFSGVVGKVVMPTLAAVLMFAAAMSLRPGELHEIWRTGRTSQVALAGTFVATMLLPVAAAVGVGVLISLLLQLNKDALDLAVVQLVARQDGVLVERPAPRQLPDRQPVILDVYGSLLYAGARTLEARLPDPREADGPIVILRLRGRTSLGATFFAVVAGYGDALSRRGGRLYLSGVDSALLGRFQRSQTRDVRGNIQIFTATEAVGESTLAALGDASTWLVTAAEPGTSAT